MEFEETFFGTKIIGLPEAVHAVAGHGGVMDDDYPIKPCDYCNVVGKAYTFLSNETICHKCFMSVPTEPRLLRKEVFTLRIRIAEFETENSRLSAALGNFIGDVPAIKLGRGGHL